MKIVWHIFRKDLRRVAVPVALLALVFAVKFIVGWRLIVGDDPTREGFERAESLVNLFRGLELAGSYFLTLRLIGEDSVVATLAFWRTRPISGGRLLAAKLLGLGLMLGVLPVLISLPWWLGCGLNAGQFALAVLETVALQLVVVAPAVLIAVLTDSLARALLWSLVVGAMVGTLGVIWLLLTLSGDVGLAGSQLIVGAVVISATIGTLLGLQFFTRRARRSVALALGGALLAWLCAIAWPWNFSEPLFPEGTKRHRLENPVNGEGVRIRGGSATLSKSPGDEDKFPSWEVRINLVAGGVPASLRLMKGRADHSWRWPDGKKETEQDRWGRDGSTLDLGQALGVRETPADEETQYWLDERRAGRRSETPPAVEPGEMSVLGLVNVPLRTAIRLRDTSPAYEFLGWFALVQPTLVLELPMIAGPWRAAAGRGLRIVSVGNQSGAFAEFSLSIIEGRFESALERWSNRHFPNPFSKSWDDDGYFSLDRVLGDWGWTGESARANPMVRIGSVELGLRQLSVRPPKVIRDGKWVVRSTTWRETTSLIVVDFPEVARFLRSLKVENFKLEKGAELLPSAAKP